VPRFQRRFDVVVHAAGDARSQMADAVNYQGTINLCKGLDANPPQEMVFISSVQVYGKEEGVDYDEMSGKLSEIAYENTMLHVTCHNEKANKAFSNR
jgi:nucleoside-diphosphate-sugar epimerase